VWAEVVGEDGGKVVKGKVVGSMCDNGDDLRW
jgi:hypothetical protein